MDFDNPHPFTPQALPRFIVTTDPSATVSSSVDFPGDTGYTTYLAPPISRRDEDGFSSCSAHPCHRAAPITPPERIDASVRIRRSVLPSPHNGKLGLRGIIVSGPPMGSLALRPGDSLTTLKVALSVGFRSLGFPPVCDSSYRTPDSCPGGIASRWMHQPSTGRTVMSIPYGDSRGGRSRQRVDDSRSQHRQPLHRALSVVDTRARTTRTFAASRGELTRRARDRGAAPRVARCARALGTDPQQLALARNLAWS